MFSTCTILRCAILPHTCLGERREVLWEFYMPYNVIKEYECLRGSVMIFPHHIISCFVYLSYDSRVSHTSIQLIARHQITKAFYILEPHTIGTRALRYLNTCEKGYEERENRPVLIINLWILICATWSINIWKRIFCVMNSNESWKQGTLDNNSWAFIKRGGKDSSCCGGNDRKSWIL